MSSVTGTSPQCRPGFAPHRSLPSPVPTRPPIQDWWREVRPDGELLVTVWARRLRSCPVAGETLVSFIDARLVHTLTRTVSGTRRTLRVESRIPPWDLQGPEYPDTVHPDPGLETPVPSQQVETRDPTRRKRVPVCPSIKLQHTYNPGRTRPRGSSPTTRDGTCDQEKGHLLLEGTGRVEVKGKRVDN